MVRPGLLLSSLVLAGCSIDNPVFDLSPEVGTGADPGTSTGEPDTGDPSGEPTTTTTPPMPAAECGDEAIDPGEQCDDGNAINDDGCTNTCTLPACGDGVKQAGEQCDDGNTSGLDMCTHECVPAACGDGLVNGQESCDDGNDVADDGCDACVSVDCGNGSLDDGEACDDGNKVDDDACTNACHAAVCGDGLLYAPMEACDDGNTIVEDDCVECAAAVCGDSVVWAGQEECDDGNMDDGDGCTALCQVVTCGNGVIDAGEECEAAVEPFSAIPGLCGQDCTISGCFRRSNTAGIDIGDNNWLKQCTEADGKVVVATLLDESNQLVYLASGNKNAMWTPWNLTFWGANHYQEYDVTKHNWLVGMQRVVPVAPGLDLLMLTSSIAHPGEPGCHKSLGDGYGVALFADKNKSKEPKLLVMGVNGGETGQPRKIAGFGAATEIAYDGGKSMDVCDGKVVGFPGTFILSVLPL